MLKLMTLMGFAGEKLQWRMRRLNFTAWLALLWLLSAYQLRAVTFSVLLDRDQITMGESITMTLKIEGGDTPNPTLPALPDLAVEGPSRAEQQYFSFNGTTSERSSTVTYTYEVTPRRPGTFQIPALTVSILGQRYTSQPMVLRVAVPGKGENIIGGAFLKIVVPKNQIYIGEILPVDIQIFFKAISGGEMPHLNEEGFMLGKMLQPAQTSTVHNGVQYNLATIKTYVVAAKLGKLDLGPATMSMNVPRSEARNFFGQYVDWQHVTLQSEPLTLTVLPLPKENVPPDFNGAVGNLASMSFNVNPTNVALGDPITIKIQLTGQGALENFSLPTQTGWDHFKMYPATSDFQPADQLGISGTKSFSLTVVPESMEVKELPPYVFSFFDPDLQRYRTLTQPALPIIVRPSAASLPPPTFTGNNVSDNPSPNQDISPIKTRPGFLAQIQPPLLVQPWFLGLQFLPVIAWLALLLRRRQQESLANNPRLRRQRQVEQTVRAGLKELQQSANANETEQFFATVFRLLQEQLGERLNLPASAITEAIVEERLRPLHVPEEQLAELRELFHACNQARYARQSTNQELLSLISRVECAINHLKELKA